MKRDIAILCMGLFGGVAAVVLCLVFWMQSNQIAALRKSHADLDGRLSMMSRELSIAESLFREQVAQLSDSIHRISDDQTPEPSRLEGIALPK